MGLVRVAQNELRGLDLVSTAVRGFGMMVGMDPTIYATLSSGERIKIGEVVECRLANTAPVSFPPPIHEIAPASVAMQFTGNVIGMSSKLRGFLLGIGRSKRSRENTRRRRDIGRAARRRPDGEP